MDNFDKIFEEWLSSMRDPTPEEWDHINNYIESISHPTGINIFDLMNEEQREHDILYESTYILIFLSNPQVATFPSLN